MKSRPKKRHAEKGLTMTRDTVKRLVGFASSALTLLVGLLTSIGFGLTVTVTIAIACLRGTAGFAVETPVHGNTVSPSATASPAIEFQEEEIPFWKAKKEIYRRIKEDRYIAVSAKSEDKGEEKTLIVQTAGVIHAPVDFVHHEVSDFSAYSKFVPYMEESSFDKTTQDLFVHGAVLGYHVRMTMHMDQKAVPEGHVIDWKTVSGSYVGMVGQINEKRLDADHTEISLSARYQGASLGVPQFLLNWGLEFAAQRAAGEMRRHIETDFSANSKNIDSARFEPQNGPVIEIRVAFADTDAMGIVHHANYLRYFEVARVGFLREKGLDYRQWQARGQHLPLVESFCRYRKPAKFEDILDVAVAPRVDGIRVTFEYEIKNRETQTVLATGHTTHVCVDDNMKVRNLPSEFLAKL